MPKYRYANANGQILPSKQLKNAQVSTQQVFSAHNAYDLRYSFATGSVGAATSFIAANKITGYTAVRDSLQGWWRLEPSALKASLTDSSGRGNIATPPSSSAKPANLAGKRTPSRFLQRDSLYFYKDGGTISQLVVTASVKGNFTFGNNGVDEPFSIAGWFYPGHTASGNKVLISKSLNHVATKTEWKLMMGGDELQLWLYDASTGAIRYKGTNAYNFSTSTWYHFVVTYDGRGGTNCANGINFYINGALVSSAGGSGGGTYNSMIDTGQPVTIGAALAASNQGWQGYIAELAIWDRKLQASDAKALYGVTNSGAYRLVRDFHQRSPSNDTRIMEVATQERGYDVTGHQPFAIDATRQGVSVKTFDHLTAYTSFKMRSNTNMLTTINGVDANNKWFDDTRTVNIPKGMRLSYKLVPGDNANDIIVSGNCHISGSSWSRDYSVVPPAGEASGSWSSSKIHLTIGSFGKISQRVDHMIEHRDLGQQVLYDNADAFEDTSDLYSRFPKARITSKNKFERAAYSSSLNPTTIITTHPEALVFPIEMVTVTGDEMTDGVIEPLTIRSVVDRTSIELPYEAHTFRASLGGNVDAFRRSLILDDGLSLTDPRGTAPFLDSVESIGGSGSIESDVLKQHIRAIDIPGAFSTQVAKIEPYVDYANDYDKEYTNNGVSSTIASTLKNSDRAVSGSSGNFVWLKGSGSISLESERTHDLMATRGFTFVNNPIGIDSIAYGGLKK